MARTRHPYGLPDLTGPTVMLGSTVIEQSPVFDQDLRLTQIIEDFTGEEFVSKLGVEALAVSVSQGDPGSM